MPFLKLLLSMLSTRCSDSAVVLRARPFRHRLILASLRSCCNFRRDPAGELCISSRILVLSFLLSCLLASRVCGYFMWRGPTHAPNKRKPFLQFWLRFPAHSRIKYSGVLLFSLDTHIGKPMGVTE